MNISDSKCEMHTRFRNHQMGFNVFSKGLQLQALNHGKSVTRLIQTQADWRSFIKVRRRGEQVERIENTGGTEIKTEEKRGLKRPAAMN